MMYWNVHKNDFFIVWAWNICCTLALKYLLQASFFIKQILLGVQHLHNHNVAHLDLKVLTIAIPHDASIHLSHVHNISYNFFISTAYSGCQRYDSTYSNTFKHFQTYSNIFKHILVAIITIKHNQPENVMLLGDNSRIIKLIDFGLSRKIMPGTEVELKIENYEE